MNNEKIDNGKFVAFSYKVTDPEGNLLFEATPQAPDTLVYGFTEGVVPGLQAALKGLGAGDKFELTLPPEAAFGQRNKDLVFNLPHDVFSADGSLPDSVKVDAVLPMVTDNGQKVYGRVTKITPTEVVMDFNHPFAGQTVTFNGKVEEVRPATDDEMHPKGCGGCCGGGGGCGSDCGSGCESGCNSGGCGGC